MEQRQEKDLWQPAGLPVYGLWFVGVYGLSGFLGLGCSLGFTVVKKLQNEMDAGALRHLMQLLSCWLVGYEGMEKNMDTT